MQSLTAKKTIRGAALLLLALLGGSARAKILDTLMVEGLLINSPSVVYNTIGLQKGQPFDASAISDGIAELYNLGLFKAVDVFAASETDSSATLVVKVEEFPLVEAIDWSGNKKLKKDELEEKLTIKKGQIASDALLFENIAKIKKLYADKGYLRADLSYQLQPTRIPGNVDVKFSIKEGGKVQVKTITFHGNAALTESKLKGEFKVKEKRWWRSGDFDPAVYRTALDTLIMYYNDQGYLDAEIGRDSVWYGEN
ncbi:MAG: POTRA domain-containing protein, partial [Chitinivibrionales bacterium]|nr:POTRA domain-containing protein [Chitinivibrionales bacterium]